MGHTSVTAGASQGSGGAGAVAGAAGCHGKPRGTGRPRHWSFVATRGGWAPRRQTYPGRESVVCESREDECLRMFIHQAIWRSISFIFTP